MDCFYVIFPFQSDLFSPCNSKSPKNTERFWISIFRNPKKFLSEQYVSIFQNGMFTKLRDAKQPGTCRVIDFGFFNFFNVVEENQPNKSCDFLKQFRFMFLSDVLSRSKKEIRNTKMFSGYLGVQFRRFCWVFLQEIQKLFPLKSRNFFLKLKKNHLLFKKKILNMFVSLTSISPKVASYKKEFLKILHNKKP